MGFVSFKDKQKHLKNNIDVCAEREVRQFQKNNNKSLKTAERQGLKKKWIKRAEHIDKDQLHSVWNPETDKTPDTGSARAIGYFGGANFDGEGNLIR